MAHFFLTVPLSLILEVAIVFMHVSLFLLCFALVVGIFYKIICWLQDLSFSYAYEDKHQDSKLAMTLNLIGSWVTAFSRYLDNKIDSLREFGSVYYENNCPPIVLEEEGKDDDDDNDD